jgi:hypothetical protein
VCAQNTLAFWKREDDDDAIHSPKEEEKELERRARF